MHKSTSLVSLIILNHNGLNYLRRTIPAILELKYPNLEIIVVDNSSQDGSLEFLRKQKKITIIENTSNLGYSKAKNIGVSKSNGKYLLMLDEDILVTDVDIVSKLISFYSKLDKPAFVNIPLVDELSLSSGYTKRYGGYYSIFGIKYNKKICIKKILEHKGSPIQTAVSFGGNLFTEKKVWDDLGGFDESQRFNLDDDDISLRARVIGYNNYLYNNVFFIHLGMDRRTNKHSYRQKYLFYFPGKAKAIIKNFQVQTIFYMLPLFTFRATVKTLKQTICFLDPLILYVFFKSIIFLFSDLKKTLKKRETIQFKRAVRDRSILTIKVPEY